MNKKVLLMVFLMIAVVFAVGCSNQVTSPTKANTATNTQTNTQPVNTNTQNTDTQNTNTQPATNPDTTPPSNSAGTISSTTLAAHNSENDCWIGYNGKVYDVTDYLQMHPGGASRIIPFCGTSDAFTQAFEGQHGMKKVNVLESQGIYKGVLG